MISERSPGDQVTGEVINVTDDRRLEEVRRIGRQAVRDCEERRRRLLTHLDLAAKLTERPLSFKRPEQWTGYVPGAIVIWREDGAPIPNDSPYRRALLEIGRLLQEREAA